MTDNGLQQLAGFTNLQHLALSNTQVSNAGLQHLNGLVNLETIHLSNARVTDAAVDQLQSQLPRVKVIR